MGALGEALVGYIIIKNITKVPKGLTKWTPKDLRKIVKYDKRMFLRR